MTLETLIEFLVAKYDVEGTYTLTAKEIESKLKRELTPRYEKLIDVKLNSKKLKLYTDGEKYRVMDLEIFKSNSDTNYTCGNCAYFGTKSCLLYIPNKKIVSKDESVVSCEKFYINKLSKTKNSIENLQQGDNILIENNGKWLKATFYGRVSKKIIIVVRNHKKYKINQARIKLDDKKKILPYKKLADVLILLVKKEFGKDKNKGYCINYKHLLSLSGHQDMPKTYMDNLCEFLVTQGYYLIALTTYEEGDEDAISKNIYILAIHKLLKSREVTIKDIEAAQKEIENEG